MKILFASAATVLLFLTELCSGFVSPSSARATFGVSSSCRNVDLSRRNMAEDPLPFFAADSEPKKGSSEKSSAKKDMNSITVDEEIEELVQAEISKKKYMSNLRNEKGVDYAPWMDISQSDEVKIRQLMKEKTEARRRRQVEEKNVSGNLYLDSQAQELSGTGLNSKIIDEDVELEWATKGETNTRGFILKRRAAKTNDFSVIASYKDWGSLKSKGEDGGIYRFLDTNAGPGGWVYRVTECDNNGKESDVCQCLVEVQTKSEQKAGLIAGVSIAAIGLAAVIAGLLLDPYAI